MRKGWLYLPAAALFLAAGAGAKINSGAASLFQPGTVVALLCSHLCDLTRKEPAKWYTQIPNRLAPGYGNGYPSLRCLILR